MDSVVDSRVIRLRRQAPFAAFLDRVGRALVNPRRALSDADRGFGGAPDALLLLLLKLLCGEARFFIVAIWTLVTAHPSASAWTVLGARAQDAVGMDLVLILVGGVVMTIVAGGKRSASRDFDLAAVAWLPVLVIDTSASLLVVITGWTVPAWAASVLWAVALAWMGVLMVLGAGVARRRKEGDRDAR